MSDFLKLPPLAFPSSTKDQNEAEYIMTLRDYFAAVAVQEILSYFKDYRGGETAERRADLSDQYADEHSTAEVVNPNSRIE